MNGKDIFRGLQYIGDDLIENAETGQFPAQNQENGKTRRHIRRPLLAAALIALLLLLVGCAVVYVLKLENVKIGTGTAQRDYSLVDGVYVEDPHTVNTTTLTLAGLKGSNAYKACADFYAFKTKYTADGEEMGKAGTLPEGYWDTYRDVMDAKAQELGLENTHYANPHGLDADDHYTTAADICVLERYAMKDKTFRKIVKTKRVTLSYGSNANYTFNSTNSLLNTWKPCIGVKTGYTNNAGYCLASAAKKDGVELYAVILGCQDEGQRFTDSYRLLKWGFEHYRNTTLATAGENLIDVPVSAYPNTTVPAGVSEDENAMVLDYDGDISVDVALIDLPDGVKKGDRVGTITWRQGEKVIGSAPLVAQDDIGKPWSIFALWTAVNRMVGFFVGDDCLADSVLHTSTIVVERSNASGETIDENLEKSIRSDAAMNG